MKKFLQKTIMIIVFVFMGSTFAAQAQVTTSAMNGIVKDQKSMVIPGASVIAVHTPSGTRYVTITNSDGRFNIQGMRVGGPYSVAITYIGYKKYVVDNISLVLGTPKQIESVLTDEASTLTEVNVVGRGDGLMTNDKIGAATSVSSTQLQRLPTINRSITDFTRLTPQSNGNNFGGADNRYNNISIDGSNFNNNFGLGSNNLPGGSAQPISLDAIEQIQINLAPFDVRQSGFTGAGINAVTKSGTNQFSGSAYAFYRNEKFAGTKVDGTELPAFDKQSTKTYGIRVGGPIIKDKLFFFINGEMENGDTPGQKLLASTGAAGPNISATKAADLNLLKNHLISNYNYNPGDYQGYGFGSENKKLLLKLDWNINDSHRFSIRYNQVEGGGDILTNSSSGPRNFSNARSGSFGVYGLNFSNANYRQNNNVYSLVGELNSTFGNKFANNFIASYTRIKDFRSSDGDLFPFVDIMAGDEGAPGQVYTTFGYELFSYNNQVLNNTYSFTDNFSIYADKHTLTVGANFDYLTFANSFADYGGPSYYQFNSLSDFIANKPPTRFTIQYSQVPGVAVPPAAANFAQFGLYGQDEYVHGRVKMTLGLRADLPFYLGDITNNPTVTPLTFYNEDGSAANYNLSEMPDTKILLSPRFGLNWDINGDRSMQFRFGMGLFTGRIPFVWMVNQSGDSGTLRGLQAYTGTTAAPLNQYLFNPDINAYRPAPNPAAATLPSSFSVTGKDFKLPQIFRLNTALDVKLPGDIIGTVEGLYSRDINNAFFYNTNFKEGDASFAGADNRPYYSNAAARRHNAGTDAIVLRNSSEGYTGSITGKLEKAFSNGLFGSLAYTRSWSKDVSSNPGDRSASAWSGNLISTSTNKPALAYSQFDNPHRIIGALSYRKEYAKNFGTSVSFIYEGAPAGRYSFTYSNDMNGDGYTNDLIYVPNDPSEITFLPLTVGSGANAKTFTTQQQSDRFFELVKGNSYLNDNRGGYSERNGAVLPWRHTFDFRILQDFFINAGGKRNTLQFSFDVINVSNLISSSYGLRQVTNSNINRPLTYVDRDPSGQPRFRLNTSGTELISSESTSNQFDKNTTWYGQIGLRYIFN